MLDKVLIKNNIALVAVKLYRMHKAFKHMRSEGPPLHLVVRAGVFSFYSFLSIV